MNDWKNRCFYIMGIICIKKKSEGPGTAQAGEGTLRLTLKM